MTPPDQPPGTIRKLLKSETRLLKDHLLRLDETARERRFGHHVSDAFIAGYAGKAAEFGTIIFGYFDGGDLRAAAELKRPKLGWGQIAEAAFSVERPLAGQGIATALMGRVIRSARNRGVRHLILCCMAENAKMRAIAAKYGAELRVEDGSIVGDIIPLIADYYSLAGEMFDDRLAMMHAILDLQIRMNRAA